MLASIAQSSTICAGPPVAAHTLLLRAKGISSGGSWGGRRFSCKTSEEHHIRYTDDLPWFQLPREWVLNLKPISLTWRQAVDFHFRAVFHGTSSLKEIDPERIKDMMVHTQEEETAAPYTRDFSAINQLPTLDAAGLTCLFEISSPN